MKDDYKKLSKEWGSKRRKAESRTAKSTLKKPTREEMADLAFLRAIKEVGRRMNNPPDWCERCGMGICEIDRQWDGDKWLCNFCVEETQQ